MKTGMISGKAAGKLFIFLISFGTLFSSCNRSDEGVADFSAEDSENVKADASDDAPDADADDVTMTAINSQDAPAGGRTEAGDDRLLCAVITRTGTKAEGTIRIDFGSGCTDKRGNVRKGVILVTYKGRWDAAGSTWTVKPDNYFYNGVGLSGTRIVTNVTTDTTRLAFDVVLEDGAATWPDGSVARRRLHHRREVVRNANHVLQRLIIYGTAEGNNRNGRGYVIEILEPLVYDRTCSAGGVIIPVQGKKSIQFGARELTIDYGDGTCDNTVTITNSNGRSKEVQVGN